LLRLHPSHELYLWRPPPRRLE